MNELLFHPEKLPSLSKEEAQDILCQSLKALKEGKKQALVGIKNAGKVFFVGDIHGDFFVMRRVVERFLESEGSAIIFLGDIIDRAPPDCTYGGMNSMLLALLLKLKSPEGVFILRGNHEGNYLIECSPYELHYEIEERFGDSALHDDFVEVFKLLPLMARTPNSIFCAHGGIPIMNDWRQRDSDDRELSAYLMWGDPLDYGIDRGFGDRYNFSREALEAFLNSVGSSIFIRGHDYATLGCSIYGQRCLTLFSNRTYREYGNKGVLMANVDTNKNIRSTKDIIVEQLTDDEWVSYEPAVLD